jgi:hypothetical protein
MVEVETNRDIEVMRDITRQQKVIEERLDSIGEELERDDEGGER